MKLAFTRRLPPTLTDAKPAAPLIQPKKFSERLRQRGLMAQPTLPRVAAPTAVWRTTPRLDMVALAAAWC